MLYSPDIDAHKMFKVIAVIEFSAVILTLERSWPRRGVEGATFRVSVVVNIERCSNL